MLRDALGFDTPVIMTVFSPLAEAMYAARDRDQFLAHLREHPVVIHEALATIAENLAAHMRDVIDAGADGIFFALQGCSRTIMTEQQYREFGRPYDLMALRGASSGWLNILHVHGEKDLMFDQVLDYPVQVLSWSDRIAGPSLREARVKTSKCLMGGWNEFGALSQGPEEQIEAEAKDALAQTGGRKFILANGCSVPDDTDHRWLGDRPRHCRGASGRLSRRFSRRPPRPPPPFPLLHDVGRVAGIEASLRVVVGHGVVDRGDRFRRAGHDQLEFGRVGHDVARGVDTGNASLHRRLVDHDLVPLQLEPPRFHGAKVRDKTNCHDQVVRGDGSLIT